jgi:hypothetical protein
VAEVSKRAQKTTNCPIIVMLCREVGMIALYDED